MNRRFVSLLLVAAMTATLFTGCGKTENSAGDTSQSSKEKKELTVWVEKIFSEDANKKMQERINSFAKETGTTVKCEFIAATDFMTKLNASIEANNVPDITTGAVTKVLSYYPNIPYADVTDLVAEIGSKRAYFDSMSDGTKIEGKNYFVPYTSSSTMMFVRKDILKENGIEKIPETWDEVFDVAKKVSNPDKDIYGLGMGCGPTDEDGENVFRMMMWDNGGSFFDKDGNVIASNNAKVKEVVQKYVDLYKAGAIPPAATTWDPSGNNKSYLMGESAIVFNAPTLVNAMKSDEQYKELYSNTAVVAPPKGSAEDTVMGFATGWSIMKNSKSVDTAKDLIRYLTDNSWYDEYVKMIAPVLAPVYKDCAEQDVWKDGVNKQVLEYASKASGYYGYPVSTIKGRAIAAKNYFKFPAAGMLNSVVANNTSVEDALKQLEAGIEETANVIK